MAPSERSETSPLLSNKAALTVEGGVVPTGTLPGENEHDSLGSGMLDGTAKPQSDEEAQAEEDERVGQYQGMPEVMKQLKYIVPAVGLGIFLVAADQTLVVSTYGMIGSDLDALNRTSWIATAYFLTLTSFQPLYGKLSDIFGRKPCLLFALSVFGIGCLWCGLARNMNELILARAFAGLGGGGINTVISVMMSDIVPLRKRGTWQGIINIIFAFGAGVGAPLGGILADGIGWRWSFLGQAPLCGLAVIVVFFTLHLPKVEKKSWKVNIKRVDFLGAFTLVTAVFFLLFGLDRGSNVSWSKPIVIASLSVSIPLFAIFILVEQKFAKEPFAPGRIIFERSLFASYLCNFFSFAGWFLAIFYIPLYWQATDGLSATDTGIRLLPSILLATCGSIFGGVVMQATGKYYWLTIAAYSGLTVGMITIALCTGLVVDSLVGTIIGMVISGFGNGIGVTSSLISLIANATPQDQAVTTACSYLFRSLGSVVGLSVSATVVQQVLRNQLRDNLESGSAAEEIVRKVRESLEYIKELDPDVQVIVRECYANATRATFMVGVCIVACAAISSCFIREKKLSR